MLTLICKKGTQAINYFARKKDGKINKMKAIKLIYLADRLHLRKYGRPIVGDTYWAMKFGPVGSNVFDIANLSADVLHDTCFKYARTYISHPKGDEKLQEIISKKEVELDVFSQSDIEALERVYREFGDKDQFELAELTHQYPEWHKFKVQIIDEGKKRVKMDYLDFFKNPRNGDDIFSIETVEGHLDLSKEMYLENKEAFEALN